MADLENKKANNPETKKVKKSDKPSIWSRISAFARSIKSEVKKISWSPWTASAGHLFQRKNGLRIHNKPSPQG